jgi:hypothetical protein
MLVDKDIVKASVCLAQMTVLQYQREMRGQADRTVDLPATTDDGGAASIANGFLYLGGNIFVSAHAKGFLGHRFSSRNVVF